VSPELTAPPRTTLDCRVLVEGLAAAPLPSGFVRVGTVAGSHPPRDLVRVGADDWDSLDEALASLRDVFGSDPVSVLSIQQFVEGGLGTAPSLHTTPEGGSA
jgi:hypothetical protein